MAVTLRSLRPRPATTPPTEPETAGGPPPRSPRRRLRLAAAVVVAAGVAVAAWFATRPSSSEGQTQAPTEQVVEVTEGMLARTVSGSGTLEAATVDELSFTSAGTVTAVNVAAGDEVSAGDVLATIDSAELAAAVSEAEATVADAEARLDDDQNADASDAQIAADQSTVSAAEAQLAAAQEALDGAELVATVDGTVSAVDLVVGEQLGDSGAGGSAVTGSGSGSGASAGTLGSGTQGQVPGATTEDDSTTAQIEVVSTGSYVVTLSVDATEVGQLKEGQEATIRPSGASSTTAGFPAGGAFGGGFGQAPGGSDDDATDSQATDSQATDTEATDTEATGKVTSVGAIADASSGVASYAVEIAFTSDSQDFVVGANVDVDVTYEEVADAIQIPAQAVTTEGGTSTVTVRTDDGDEERTVELGESSGGMVQVTSGLEAGEQVVMTFRGPADAGGDGNGGDGQVPEGFPGGGDFPAPPTGGGFRGGN